LKRSIASTRIIAARASSRAAKGVVLNIAQWVFDVKEEEEGPSTAPVCLTLFGILFGMAFFKA
jgi:hypothetical protein